MLAWKWDSLSYAEALLLNERVVFNGIRETSDR